jgi:hypothetical protein
MKSVGPKLDVAIQTVTSNIPNLTFSYKDLQVRVQFLSNCSSAPGVSAAVMTRMHFEIHVSPCSMLTKCHMFHTMM